MKEYDSKYKFNSDYINGDKYYNFRLDLYKLIEEPAKRILQGDDWQMSMKLGNANSLYYIMNNILIIYSIYYQEISTFLLLVDTQIYLVLIFSIRTS